jgi:hypothetical protein
MGSSEPLQLPQIHVISVDSIESLVGSLPVKAQYFTLLLAWDAPDKAPAELAPIFRPLVQRGLAYFLRVG